MKKKKKILIVTDAWEPQINGVVTTLKNTVLELKNQGYRVKVVHPGLFRNMPCPGYSEIRLALFPSAVLESYLAAENPDMVHIATEGPLGLAMRKILRRRGEKWSSSFHTKFAEYIEARVGFGKKLAWRWLRHVYRDDAFILVTTKSMKEEMISHGFPENKLIVWGRGVDTKIFYPRERSPLESEDMPRPFYLNVGRVSVEKNLEAFYDLKMPGTKIQIGSGPMLETYKAKYPDVIFLGSKQGEELARWYSYADVFVFPSKSDTFGLVMIEAMKCGTPVAAYPVTGPKDIIESCFNGYMNDDLAMAINVCSVIPRWDVVAHSEKFTWENATQQFIKALVPRK
jgi:glycosyltransferase involved in cell wall biosynthesis